MIARLFALLVALLILAHGYFYLSFGTFDPCVAATFKVINQEQSQAARGAGLLFSAAIEKVIQRAFWRAIARPSRAKRPTGFLRLRTHK